MVMEIDDGIKKYSKKKIEPPDPNARWFLWCSDGEPVAAKKPEPMHYDDSTAVYSLCWEIDPKKRMYDDERMKITSYCANIAQKNSAECYVVTTGYGPVKAVVQRKAYNIPGEEAIRKHHLYGQFLRDRIRTILNLTSDRPIVYYAGRSRKKFRQFVWEILLENDASVVMFGATAHRPNWELFIKESSQHLLNKDEKKLSNQKKKWVDTSVQPYPFYEFNIRQ